MVWWLKFPRKVGYPWKRIVRSVSEYNTLINKLNGKVEKVYVSMYKCDNNGVTDDVLLDIVPFDIDWHDSFESMMELHNKLLEDDIKHQVMFSTGGFWVYVFTNAITKLKKFEAKIKLQSAQDKILEGTTLTFGDSKIAAIDKSVRGDVERLTRLPFSFDRRRQSYVIFLGPNDFKSMGHVKKLSMECDEIRRHQIYIFGNKFFDIEKVDCDYSRNDCCSIDNHSTFQLNDNIDENIKVILNMLPDCVKAWITDKEWAVWEARAYATLFLREKGFSQKQTEDLVKPFYEKHQRQDSWGNNWLHYVQAAQCSDHIYKRKDLKFLNCGKINSLGLCPGKCTFYKGVHKSPAYR